LSERGLNPAEYEYIPAQNDSVHKFRGLNKGKLIWIDSHYGRHFDVSEILAMASHRGLEVVQEFL
jgi:hypothetical protein